MVLSLSSPYVTPQPGAGALSTHRQEAAMKESQIEVGLMLTRVKGMTAPCTLMVHDNAERPPSPGDCCLTSRVRIDHCSVLCVTQDEHGFHIAELEAVPILYCIMASSDSELDLLRNTSQKAI